MHAFITYCSAAKNLSPYLLPSLERYQSRRIWRVKQLADAQGVAFYILSGKFALLGPTELTPYYDHLLMPSEVAALANRVAAQLREAGVTEATFFVGARKSRQLEPYTETIKQASELAGAALSVEMQEATDMSDWQVAMSDARSAKMLLLQKRSEGEKRFEELLERHGEDGMIYFIRGEAYESLGERELALNDYRLAEIMFPLPKYKEQARHAASRIETRLGPPKVEQERSKPAEVEAILKVIPEPVIVKAVRDAVQFVDASPSAAISAIGLRGVRGLIMYLERKNQLEPLGSWAKRTTQLFDNRLISKITVHEMDAAREIRNEADATGAHVTRLDAEASIKMFLSALNNVFGSKA
jgi:tetratricopeptide (TPR) repeat protein